MLSLATPDLIIMHNQHNQRAGTNPVFKADVRPTGETSASTYTGLSAEDPVPAAPVSGPRIRYRANLVPMLRSITRELNGPIPLSISFQAYQALTTLAVTSPWGEKPNC